jgi:response regulator of citrate/malate metabolism
MKQTKSPKWAKTEASNRSVGKSAFVVALYMLQQQGRLTIENKSEFAKKLGISRWSLDRYLAAIEEAKKLSEDISRKIEQY